MLAMMAVGICWMTAFWSVGAPPAAGAGAGVSPSPSVVGGPGTPCGQAAALNGLYWWCRITYSRLFRRVHLQKEKKTRLIRRKGKRKSEIEDE